MDYSIIICHKLPVAILNLIEFRIYDDRLALLWFHTIVRPFFGLDGSNSRSGADAAQRLIDSSKPEFAEASLFLFFQGRVNRLKVQK